MKLNLPLGLLDRDLTLRLLLFKTRLAGFLGDKCLNFLRAWIREELADRTKAGRLDHLRHAVVKLVRFNERVIVRTKSGQ